MDIIFKIFTIFLRSDSMSPIEIQKRQRAVKIADAISGIEGVPVSDFAKDLSDKWAQGTISDSQMIKTLVNIRRKALKNKD